MTHEKKMESATDLLGLIYETAHDPTFWPLLLDGLNTEMEAAAGNLSSVTDDPAPKPNSVNLLSSPAPVFPEMLHVATGAEGGSHALAHGEHALVARLVPHFKRALALNREYVDLEAQRTAALTVLDQVPIGILFVTHEARIVVRNKRADEILDVRSGLCEVDRHISTCEREGTQRLRKMIANVAAESTGNVHAFAPVTHGPGGPQSVLVVPYVTDQNAIGDGSVSAVLLVASPEVCSDVSEDALVALFGLSEKEARVAKHVAGGMKLESYEEKFHVARNTVKSQLKSVFDKIGVSRQSDLVRMILTSPAVFAGKYTRRPAPASRPLNRTAARAVVLRDDVIELPGGRRLGFAEYGDPDGDPVMLFHGTYGCRKQRYPDDELTRACGVRLIVPERPGFGVSSEHEGRSFVSWAEDVAYFADRLNLDRFAIIGHDAGGCYACACALEMPRRLSNVVVVNSLAPFHSLSEYHGIMPNEKLFYALAHYAPSLFARFARFTLKGLANNVKWYFDSLPGYLDESDLELLRDERLVENFKEMFAEAGRNSVSGFAQDMALVAGAWDFDPARITVPVHVWHGKKNVHVPFAMGERLARLIPKSIPRFLDGDGHYTLYKRWRELLSLARSGLADGHDEILRGDASLVASRHGDRRAGTPAAR